MNGPQLVADVAPSQAVVQLIGKERSATPGESWVAVESVPDAVHRDLEETTHDYKTLSQMAPSAMKAWQTGGDVFGVVVPVENLAAHLPTFADVGGWEHFVPGGRTAVKVGGEFFIKETREFVVEGGIPMPPGSVVSGTASELTRNRLMSRTIPFHDQGCKYCREFWISRSDQPKLIGVSLEYQCHLYRCCICCSWWEYGSNYPHVIDEDLAVRIAATVARDPS